jgi:chemotaxis response regulator CheB
VAVSAVPYADRGVRCDLRYRVTIIAASAGGLSALAAVLGSLPPDFPLPVGINREVRGVILLMDEQGAVPTQVH